MPLYENKNTPNPTVYHDPNLPVVKNNHKNRQLKIPKTPVFKVKEKCLIIEYPKTPVLIIIRKSQNYRRQRSHYTRNSPKHPFTANHQL